MLLELSSGLLGEKLLDCVRGTNAVRAGWWDEARACLERASALSGDGQHRADMAWWGARAVLAAADDPEPDAVLQRFHDLLDAHPGADPFDAWNAAAVGRLRPEDPVAAAIAAIGARMYDQLGWVSPPRA